MKYGGKAVLRWNGHKHQCRIGIHREFHATVEYVYMRTEISPV
jgi:hypothetical protein